MGRLEVNTYKTSGVLPIGISYLYVFSKYISTYTFDIVIYIKIS